MQEHCEPDFDQLPVLVHVGLHKCASTWLQQNMFDNPRIGLVSPWGRLASIAVSEFVNVDPLAFDAGVTRRRLAEAASPAACDGLAVLSHEALSSRPHQGQYYAPYVAERLGAVFGNARILVILREQRSMIKSLYGEHLRNGGRSSLREFLGTGHEPPGFGGVCKLSFFEYDRLIGMYRAAFGSDRVLALPMEMLSRSPDDFIARICGFVGCQPVELPTERRLNTAWGPVTYQVLRHSNAVFRAGALRPKTGPAFRARRHVLNLLDRIMPDAVQSRVDVGQKKMIADRVGRHFAESNARVAELLSIDLASFGYDCTSSLQKRVDAVPGCPGK